MNHFIKLTGLLLLPAILIGCGGGPKSKPSEKYPEQVLFQHIEITATRNAINAKSEYFSNNVIYFSSNDEKQFLSINDDQKFELAITRTSSPSYPSGPSYVTDIEVDQPLIPGDQFKVIFERSNGNILESTASLPEFIQFISPFEAQEIDHSTEDLIIEWDLAANKNSTLSLQGECLLGEFHNLLPNMISFNLEPGQTSLTIDANSLEKHYEFEEDSCEVTAHLYNETKGINDTDFAGGTYKISSHSTRKFILKNLQAGN
jgi:hypothetical protein